MARPVSRMTEPAYFVLAALLDGPLHGYGIIKKAADQSSGRLRLAVGTLYGVLERLSAAGFVVADGEEQVEGRTRRYYRLSETGRRALHEEAARMERAAAVVTQWSGSPVPDLA